METMHVFHIRTTDQGEEYTANPRVPETASHIFEDVATPRVCVCPSIYQCLVSTYALDLVRAMKKFYVYEADVPIEHLYQPNTIEVRDSCFTGELWITYPVTFTRRGEYYMLRRVKTSRYNDHNYSWWTFARNGYKRVQPFATGRMIGGTNDSFVFLDRHYKNDEFPGKVL